MDHPERARWIRNALSSVAFGCMSCSGSNYGDAPGASGSQLSFELALPGASQNTIAAVVDDTPPGAQLRKQLAPAFDAFEAWLEAASLPPGVGIRDPAVWLPIDRSVVITHPSAGAGARFSSPATDPALRWRENNQSSAGRAAWLTAVRQALEAQPAAVGAPFQALAAFHDTSTLLHGTRQPATVEEQSLLAALPDTAEDAPYIPVSVAVATEDESSGAASQYMDQQPDALIVPAANPATAGPTGACVPVREGATPRYEGWTVSKQLWPCVAPALFTTESSDSVPRCLSRPLAMLANGQAACVASVSYHGTEPCPADHGWLDPVGPNGVRAARVDHSATGDTRVCEVQQLDGAALASCQSSLACTDCQPGWCATTVPELIPDKDCAPGAHYPPFRFVLGAGTRIDPTQAAEITIVCDEASSG
jgi:hypothetical protein